MDFISSIWKTTSKPEPKVPEADAPDVPSKPVDEEPKETVIPPKEASAGSDSGSTSGPDSEAPPSPETPNPDVQNEDKASVGTSISVPLENVSQKALESAKSLGSKCIREASTQLVFLF